MLSAYYSQIIIVISLLIFSALFSAADAAYRLMSTVRAHQISEETTKKNPHLLKNYSRLNIVHGALIIGDNLANIFAISFALYVLFSVYGPSSIIPGAISMIVLVLFFGEILPNSITSQHPENVALSLARFVRYTTFVLMPLVQLMLILTEKLTILFGGDPANNKPFVTEEELISFVETSHQDGILETEEKNMIYNVVEFGDIQVSEVMTPRTDMVTAKVDSTYDDLFALFKTEQFTRMPLFESTKDNIVGILNIKDLIFYEGPKTSFSAKTYMREPFYTYEFKNTATLFTEMKFKKQQMAVVLDEYGGTAGILTLEDLIEEIVGELNDEYDDDTDEAVSISDNVYRIEGTMKLDDFNDRFKTNLTSEESETIGGFIMDITGRIPELGECISYGSIAFRIEAIDKNRIQYISIDMANYNCQCDSTAVVSEDEESLNNAPAEKL